MHKKTLWMTQTALLLALLICLQWVGSMIPEQMLKQLVTGSLVNCVLAVTVLLVGLGSGLTVAVISPVCAFLLSIAPNFVTVLPIMAGNSCFVLLLHLLLGKSMKPLWKQPVALAAAATAKFLVLYLLVVQVICGIAADSLLGKKLGSTVVLAKPMLTMLPTMFTWPQLVTALIGGTVALLMIPALKKAVRH